jgi:hypothetical protein
MRTLALTLLAIAICTPAQALTVLRVNSEVACVGLKKGKNICINREGVVAWRPFSSGLRRSQPGYVRPDTLPPNYRDYRGYGGR